MSEPTELTIARRSQILDAAVDVFARKGFHKARMDDIVAESGLSKGALYWYFTSKDELIRAILDRFFDSEMKDLAGLVSAGGSAFLRLEQVQRQVGTDLARFNRLLPITFEFYAVASRQEGVQAALQGYFEKYRRLLTALIQQGIDRGEFQPVDADQIALVLIALFEGTLLLNVLDPQAVDWSVTSEAGLKWLMAAIQTGPG
jgi:AcrR family transcriptional regulator